VAIATTDLDIRLSVPGAAAGNVTAAGAAGSYLGKYAATTAMPDNTLDNVFPDATGDENANSNSDYQCVFIINNHATLTLQNAVVWLVSEVAGGASYSLGADPTAASAKGASAAQAVSVADKNTAPAGVTFTAPTSKGAGIALGNIGPAQVKAFWVRRALSNSSALTNDGATFRVEGDTAP
jgi:hypothetical protein